MLDIASDAISRGDALRRPPDAVRLLRDRGDGGRHAASEQSSRLQIYLVAYVAMALLVSLWVLPGLVAALTPIRTRDLLASRATR